jgi:acetyl-CoA acetyltransferase family protein
MKRVAIIGGIRTPFVKAGGVFAKYSQLDLGAHVLTTLVKKLNLDDKLIEEFAFGSVLIDPRTPNLAREVLFRAQLSPYIPAHFVANNCISGLVALNTIAQGIKSGRIECGVAGGVESMSQPTLTYPKKGERFFLKLASAKSFAERVKIIAGFKPGMIVPVPPSPREPSTGLSMGEHCEMMAKEFKIERAVQDQFALKSHNNAARAQKDGFLNEEIAPLDQIKEDNLIRADTNIEKLAKLKPAFDKSEQGSITAGNSSALTDGASLVCLMSEEKARALSYPILAYFGEVQYAALPPEQGLLMAPAIALPNLLKRAQLSVNQVDFFEIHEAFSAQVIANLMAWSKGWRGYATLDNLVPGEKININGGSIAIGHPFAATGGRIVLSLANQLKRSGKELGVISICAAGGMAAAALISRR